MSRLSITALISWFFFAQMPAGAAQTPARAKVQPPDFATIITASPTEAQVFDAVETLALKNHEEAYRPLEDAVRALSHRTEYKNTLVKAIVRFPVRAFLPELAALLPAKWQGASDNDLAVVTAIAGLRAPMSVGLVLTSLQAAVAENAEPRVVEHLAGALTSADPPQALETIFALSGVRYGRPLGDFWLPLVRNAIASATLDDRYHGPLVRLIQDSINQHRVGGPGAYTLRFGTQPASVQLSRSLSAALTKIGTVSSLSALLFFTLSDDPEAQKVAMSADYSPLAAALWLVADPVAFAALLQKPEPKVKELLAGLAFPSPAVFPLASAQQQLVLRRLHELSGPLNADLSRQFGEIPKQRAQTLAQVDRYVFKNLAGLLKLTAMDDAELPDNYNPEESAPLVSEKARLAGAVAFGLDKFQLSPSVEAETAGYLVHKKYQLLAATLYSLIRAERSGIPVGAHASLADLDAQFDALTNTPAAARAPRTQIVEKLPDAPAEEGSLSCDKSTALLTSRSLSVGPGQYAEELSLKCAESVVQKVRWQGSVPFALQPILLRHPRLLDFAGVSLSLREWRFSGQSVPTQVDDLDVLMQFPERVIPLLTLLWNTGDVAWKDVRDTVLSELYALTRDRLQNPQFVRRFPVAPSFDPILPAALAPIANRIPGSSVLPAAQLDALTTLFQDQLKSLLAAKGKARVLTTARRITAEKMPDRVWESYSVPCGDSARPMTCSGSQYVENRQKRALLAQYDAGIVEAGGQERALQVFDVGSVPNRQLGQITLLRGWAAPTAERYLGLYLIGSAAGERVVFSGVRLENMPNWTKAALLVNPSLLSLYRVDLAGSSSAAAVNSALVLATSAQALQFAELAERDALTFSPGHALSSIGEPALKDTEYGRSLLRELSWQENLLSTTRLGAPGTDYAATPDFGKRAFEAWDQAVAALEQAVRQEEDRVRAELERQLDRGITIGFSVTIAGPGPPIFGISLGSGPWNAIVSTNFSTILTVFPSWNGIGLPIPIRVGTSPAPAPADAATPRTYGAEPVPREISGRQADSQTFVTARAGRVLLSGPASYMEVTAAASNDPQGWAAYVSSLVQGRPNWSEAKARAMVAEFMRCKEAIDDRTPCNVFVKNVLKGVFNIADFSGFPVLANEISDYLANNPGLWEHLGNGSSQQALTLAQAEANNGNPVIAVWKNPNPAKPGHVAIIILGTLTYSGTWGRFVPNAAQTRLGDFFGDTSGVWIGRPLSNSFGGNKAPRVDIYVRR